ncbi:response regulator transcription factor [Flavobacterium agrisoli]|uniref:Response regulator transcription factor n=1 Tax=Flavobacterium agrisoli TaxID=2793066 RepID=A0A934UK45_9FLAO|nr:response regulator transcription factor [Flavobacterium agrisoli]MBK0370080.1 response regulator transcription factor [Flavobacterium agrisoli]
MYKKALVADDVDLNDIAVVQVMKELGITTIEYAKYCDDAILKIKKGIHDGEPYELLITDLSFKSDYKNSVLASGEELIAVTKKLNTSIKIIAFSIEDKSFRIKALFERYAVDGFVLKGRRSIEELRVAIKKVYDNTTFISPEVEHVLKENSPNVIDDFDIKLLGYLSNGIAQEAMEATLKSEGITPNSKSTVEKRIAKLKDCLKANNTIHLVAIAKDLGII